MSLRQYVDGLLGDSARKSMSAMLERISEPTSYQAFQHFITHAPWDAETLWRRVRRVMPERTGVLILDETSFPKAARIRSAGRGSTAGHWARSRTARLR